ncbi:tetratricopeptide repeat protein [Micromonospora sp. WMMD975]|uniref:tetratricopeptide repeat protein n=1 Tax=Micromonospora sp. WMMD975 TaxID=3016087 RepID=UPI00249C7861|nr:tetratricopeptide repeat protein [Micromonospora sp. WMMD975]WFE35092.1 tetratricopeptide repeat protein [Micromonospora sp. WMMD975]
MATGLVTVRDVIRRVNRGDTRSAERAALAKVAESAAFDGLGPSSKDRGRWIVARIRSRLLDLERGATGSAADRAVRCWARYIDEGLTPIELYRAHPHLILNDTATDSTTALRQRVQSLMWAGGARGDRDSFPGVLMLVAELRTALSTDLPDGPRMDAATFGYEWRRLSTAAPAGRDLLQVLARLAPDHPFPKSLLRGAGDCLPGLAEIACASPTALRETCTALRTRGLLDLDGDHVSVPTVVAAHVVGQVTLEQAAHWTAAVLRFLTHALRPDTHHIDAWAEWEFAYPHVLAVCGEAERRQTQLNDVAYLLDRASVYLREGVEDPDGATTIAERAATVAQAVEDHELMGDTLGNLALAHRAANRTADAVSTSTRSLDHAAAAYGTDHETYAESLTVHANILAAAGSSADASRTHEQAVGILRTLYTARPTDHIRGLLVEALNDHAKHLLSTGAPVTAGRELLKQADRLVRRGEHGWTQITLNLARACRTAGDLAAARDYLESLRDYCDGTRLDPSTTLVCTLVDLAEVYDELGDKRAGPTLRRAHRVDNALAAALDRPLRHGRSS